MIHGGNGRIGRALGLIKRAFREPSHATEEERPPRPSDAFVICENLVKIYRVSEIEVMALQGLDLEVKSGEIVAIIGSSGSGKSTLLNILGGLDQPTAGRAMVGRWDLTRMTEAERISYRLKVVGFVWQNVARNLIPYLTALENVELPMVLTGRLDPKRARELLCVVGLGDRMHHLPHQLSGGEQQRVAVAIGLANQPELLLADEPTGSLDSTSAKGLLEAFHRVREVYGVTIIIVTHDLGMARSVDRFVRIRDGKISTEAVRRGNPGLTEGSRPASVHEELTVLDSAGRLQIPPELLSELGIRDRVKLEKEGDRIVLRLPDAPEKGE